MALTLEYFFKPKVTLNYPCTSLFVLCCVVLCVVVVFNLFFIDCF